LYVGVEQKAVDTVEVESDVAGKDVIDVGNLLHGDIVVTRGPALAV